MLSPPLIIEQNGRDHIFINSQYKRLTNNVSPAHSDIWFWS